MNMDKPEEIGRISFVVNPFHKQKITAIATCMKQPLLITASDCTLFMWHYNGPASTMVLINAQILDGPINALALHPTGHYIVISHFDKIKIYSVMNGDALGNHSKPVSVTSFHQFPMKGADEIKFAHGGHLFAVNDDDNAVHIFKFFHGDKPENYTFRGHESKVSSITWLDDDTGFVTIGKDSKAAYWRLSDIKNY